MQTICCIFQKLNGEIFIFTWAIALLQSTVEHYTYTHSPAFFFILLFPVLHSYDRRLLEIMLSTAGAHPAKTSLALTQAESDLQSLLVAVTNLMLQSVRECDTFRSRCHKIFDNKPRNDGGGGGARLP